MSIPPTHERPKVRGECANGPRPCPWVGCRHHLYLEVSEKTGKVRLNFPDLEPWELEHSCALDEAAEGPLNLGDIGVRLGGLSKEFIRQVEARALGALSLEHDAEAFGFTDHKEEARAQWQSATQLSLSMGVSGPEYIRRRAGKHLRGYIIEEQNGRYRAVRPDTEEDMVDANATGETVGQLETNDGGDPWVSARTIGDEVGLSHAGVVYRYRKGKPINGRIVERRGVSSAAGRQCYEYRLGAPAVGPTVADVEADLAAARGKISEYKTKLELARAEIARKESPVELELARKRVAQLEERLAADAKAAAAHIEGLKAELAEVRSRKDEHAQRAEGMRLERDEARKVARAAEADADEWANHVKELRRELASKPEKEAAVASGLDGHAIHRAIGALEVVALMVGDTREAEVMRFVIETLSDAS